MMVFVLVMAQQTEVVVGEVMWWWGIRIKRVVEEDGTVLVLVEAGRLELQPLPLHS